MVINIKPQYVVRKIYCDLFSHVMDVSIHDSCSNSELVLIHEAFIIAFTKLGGANMIAHVQWPLCLPFPHVHLFYVTPALIRGNLRSQFSVSYAMGM